jgi:hypothetical protein
MGAPRPQGVELAPKLGQLVSHGVHRGELAPQGHDLPSQLLLALLEGVESMAGRQAHRPDDFVHDVPAVVL